MVFNSNGLFSRANNTAKRYNKAKARETLEIAFRDLEIEKYERGLTTDALDTRITEEIGKMGGTENGDNKTQVIVDGYIFQVDRSVPKIIKELGVANEVIVSSKVTQNGDWKNPQATVTGTIIKYGGGTVTSSTAEATNGVTIPSDFPTKGGNFTIQNIATDTVITITTTDSSGKTKTHTIDVKLIRDETPPEIKTAEAKTNRMKITIQATAEDKESGVTSLRYSITPTTGIPAGQNEGDLTSGTQIEVTSTAEVTYTVTFTATNGAGKTATKEVSGAKTNDAMLIEEVKNTVNASNLKDYMGKKVAYQPAGDKTGVWRIFYQDNENGDDGNGYFGDGKGTIYLKRDYDENLHSALTATATAVGTSRMKKMNPLWAKDANASSVDLDNEKAVSWMCDSANWSKYCDTSVANYAMGGPSVEMYMKAYNIWAEGTTNESNLMCKIGNSYGYSLGAHDSYTWNGSTEHHTGKNAITSGPNGIFMTVDHWWWLSSPSSRESGSLCYVGGDNNLVSYRYYTSDGGFTPIISLH